MVKDSSSSITYIKERLEALHCPYLEDGSDQWLAELLLHPSEARIRLLTWIITTFDSKFHEMMDNNTPVINNRIDSRHQKMLLALSIMCACKVDDLELVRGTASQKKQLAFWDNLIDIFYTAQHGCPYTGNNDQSTDTSYFLKPPRIPTISEVFNNSCKFIDTLVREFSVSELFSTEIHLFSPDLESLIKNYNATNQILPSIDMLVQTLSKMQNDLDTCIDELNNLNEKAEFIEPEQGAVENYCRKIDLSLKLFSQMIDSYIHCHESDIDTWCNKPKPILSHIGPHIKSVDSLIHNQLKLKETLMSYNVTTNYLTSNLKEDIGDAVRNLVKPDEVSVLRETSDILRQSIRRK